MRKTGGEKFKTSSSNKKGMISVGKQSDMEKELAELKAKLAAMEEENKALKEKKEKAPRATGRPLVEYALSIIPKTETIVQKAVAMGLHPRSSPSNAETFRKDRGLYLVSFNGIPFYISKEALDAGMDGFVKAAAPFALSFEKAADMPKIERPKSNKGRKKGTKVKKVEEQEEEL